MKSKKVGAILSIVLFSLSVSACSSNMEQQRMAESATESESITEEKEVETEKETETEKQTESEKETQKETEATKESKDNNKDESTTETKSNDSKDSKVPETSKTSTPKEDSKPVETTAPQATEVPTEAPKPVHTHNYTAVVTTQPTCTTPGITTYSCSCGDSYTENLGTIAHDFSVPVTQIVHHDEVWQNVPRQTSGSRVIICGCGSEFSTQADFDNHRISSLEANGPFCSCCGPFNVEDRPGETVYDYVKVSDAYDTEEIVAYKCSVCGQTQ